MATDLAAGLVPGAPSCCGAPQDSPHEQRRKHVLRAAEACFARSGFHGASMQEICAEAQMSPGALYRYFRSKDDIIGAIADEERVRNAELIAALEAPGSLVDRLVGLTIHHIEAMRRPGAISLMAEVMAEGMRNPTIGCKFMRNEDEARAAIQAFLEARVAAGEIAPVEPIGEIIGFMCAVVDGLVLRSAFDPGLTNEKIEIMLRRVVVGLLRPAGDDENRS